MAGGRRLVAHARRGGDDFYSWAQGGGGCFLVRQGNQAMVWAATWPEYGGKGRRRAATVRPMAALGRHGVASAHAPRGSAKDPQTSCTGTKEHGARTAGRGPASACVYDRYGGTPTRQGASSVAMSRAWGALALAQFKVALFDQDFFEFLLQK
jgi:hypothetical protein